MRDRGQSKLGVLSTDNQHISYTCNTRSSPCHYLSPCRAPRSALESPAREVMRNEQSREWEGVDAIVVRTTCS
jgi:hypothetical protein